MTRLNGWQLLLFPFALIYDIVTRCRNWLYDAGIFASRHFPDLHVISVGNLSVGGTGKTPMVEYLIRKGVDMKVPLAVLSRGYGRRTRGVRIAAVGDSASDLGDESYGYFAQFGDSISVVVAEKRVQGLETIRRHFPDIGVVILDDAFQHRAVKPDYSVLLTPFATPFWKDYVLPAGRLREARKGCHRADALILTKCPQDQDVSQSSQWQFLKGTGRLSAATTVRYGEFVEMQGNRKPHVIAVAGLADNQPFFAFLLANYSVRARFSFSDHKKYTADDVQKIIRMATTHDAMVITTFKDAVKLKDIPILETVSWGYVPIETVFVEGEEEFLKNLTPFLNPPSESVDHP